MKKIVWTKEYQEDLGTKDEKGWYEYAYRYYIYWFYLPDDQKIKVRRYTDTLDHCSIFVSLDDLETHHDLQSSGKKDYIFGIINFLLVKEGIKTIDYFNESYKPVDLINVKNNLAEFTFEELSVE